jgi:glycosyltransferase involved in cell wall biosynthesis
LTTVSEPLAVKLRQEYDKPVHVITNGFDPDDFDAASNSLPPGWNDTVKNAVYTGMIHPDRQNPGPLFEAIQLLIENHRIRKGDFAFRLFGPNNSFVKSLFPSRLLEDFVIVGNNLHRNQALNCQKNADLLIVFDWMDPEEKGVYTTKFFEYIGAGKPILSIGHKGSVIDITLKTKKLGITENNPLILAKILERFIKNGTIEEFSPRNAKSRKLLIQFTREYQAEKLAGILGRVIDRN